MNMNVLFILWYLQFLYPMSPGDQKGSGLTVPPRSSDPLCQRLPELCKLLWPFVLSKHCSAHSGFYNRKTESRREKEFPVILIQYQLLFCCPEVLFLLRCYCCDVCTIMHQHFLLSSLMKYCILSMKLKAIFL